MANYTHFQTQIGPCSLHWNEIGLTALVIDPEKEDKIRQNRLSAADKRADTIPVYIEKIINQIHQLLLGQQVSFIDAPLDWQHISDFNQKIYRNILLLKCGDTTTYGEVAKAIGQPRAAQAVGNALGQNPWPIIVPCHRILGRDGKIGGFSANGGIRTKQILLNLESPAKTENFDLFGGLPLQFR